MNTSTRQDAKQTDIKKVVMLGSALPRQCGIATFSDDLANALSDMSDQVDVSVVAVSDHDRHAYSGRVGFEIRQQNIQDYVAAAKFINESDFDVLSLQHEFGLFGGESGSHLIALLEEVNIPVVTTLHTVLRDPSPSQRYVMRAIAERSERLVVMSGVAIEILTNNYRISREKIDLIPHGIPNFSPCTGRRFRESLGIDGPMILTFGLLSPDKGIETVIKGMPQILEQIPDAVYVVLGATHPHVRQHSGEAYRDRLQDLCRDLGIQNSVRFVDEFVPRETLVEYLGATDIYVTPYLKAQQITSGTLAYAVGAGKVVISTPYWYAEELLADGRGKLVPFGDPDAIAKVILDVHAEPHLGEEMGRRASAFAQSMTWPNVARKYIASFQDANLQRKKELANSPVTQMPLPPLNFDHLLSMTDSTGLLQHAFYRIPNRFEGYCVDDNCRALLLTGYLEQASKLDPLMKRHQETYLSFVHHSLSPTSGRFRNFMSYGREWLEDAGSEDSQGRVLWSIGTIVRSTRDDSTRTAAECLFRSGVPGLVHVTSPRACAYIALGCAEFLSVFPADPVVRSLLAHTAQRLSEMYWSTRTEDWCWFEDRVSYANARLSQALLVAGDHFNVEKYRTAGLESLRWLMEVQSQGNVFVPIGSAGYIRGQERSRYDQQPIEAWASLSACRTAFGITRDPEWNARAESAFQWFFGGNSLGVSLYDAESGGCRDGLHPDLVNENQGAESTLSCLCSRVEMELLRNATAQPTSSQLLRTGAQASVR